VDSESSNGWCHPPFEHLVAPCKVIQESVLDSGIHTVDSRFHVCGFQIPHPWIPEVAGFQISKFYFGFRIPLAGFRIPKPWILGSTDQNYLDSRFRITLHGAKFGPVHNLFATNYSIVSSRNQGCE